MYSDILINVFTELDIMKIFNRQKRDKIYSTGIRQSFSKLSRLWWKLSWIFLWSLLPLEIACEGLVLIIFLLSARYDSITGCEDIEDFSRNLEYFGVYDLPCGGGIITNPDGAARWLRRGYGQKGAASRCIFLLSRGPLTNDSEKLTVSLACDLLYRLGDSTTIDQLQGLRNKLLQQISSSETITQSQSDIQIRLKYTEVLIAGLCQRLSIEIPDNIPSLDEDGVRYWFE